MRPLQPRSTTSDEHAEAVSRRLATLSAELAAVRGDPPAPHRHTQVRGLYADEPVDPGAVPSLPARIPTPGRHASRGLVRGLAARLPLTGTHVAVIAVVIALAVGLAAWLAVRSDPEPVPALVQASEPLTTPSVSAVNPAAPGSPTTSDSPATTGGDVTVDVAGKVRRPGIAVLPPGSRVVDAVEAAGGARPGVDLATLNLARPLVDGEQILVGVSVPTGVAGSLGSPAGTAGESGVLVNLNSADLTALETLPGVGPVTAQAIVDWRTENGGFTRVDELLEVAGIGDATLAEIAPHATI
ncbi:helix-hairpin-helix domain-containing protein [Nocardioides sp.]|uniref:helix-hairpin-helix domain-containing protein n=1 Tax=Nocardioides sp. TaxID=35761 RepID=UPI002BDD861C|nr:helix-hairpin-helix domain-containing protein [Nocardioides sp.]HXH78312.1 helix-hairpin-helix domain-containing protein [Nocardioides sp.]